MRAFIHIALLLVTGAVTIFTVTPADGAEPRATTTSPAISAAIERALVVTGGRIDSAVEEKPLGHGCVPNEVTVVPSGRRFRPRGGQDRRQPRQRRPL